MKVAKIHVQSLADPSSRVPLVGESHVERKREEARYIAELRKAVLQSAP